MVEVRNNGVPLLQHAPKAGITQSISQLADALTGKRAEDAAAASDGKSRRWLGLWATR
jgi:pilus assembly protein CpaE